MYSLPRRPFHALRVPLELLQYEGCQWKFLMTGGATETRRNSRRFFNTYESFARKRGRAGALFSCHLWYCDNNTGPTPTQNNYGSTNTLKAPFSEFTPWYCCLFAYAYG